MRWFNSLFSCRSSRRLCACVSPESLVRIRLLLRRLSFYFFFNNRAPPEFSPLPLPAPLPISAPRRPGGRDVSGPTTDNAMTRSEEEVNVGTTQREAGRARLRKYVVTENVETTVPVQREEVRLEREPITDANIGDAMDGPDLSDEEHEVVLHAEQPVVEKNVVPKERVRLDKDTITEEQQVSEEVRKEQIEMEGGDRVEGDRRI